MKVRAFQVVRKRWAKPAFDRVGARLRGGRWNLILKPFRPDFREAGIGKPEVLEIDARLGRKGGEAKVSSPGTARAGGRSHPKEDVIP